jgi:hypothetical protein
MMPRRVALLALALGALFLTSGCAVNRATASLSPGADLSTVKSFYVVHLPADGRGIDKLIRDNLVKRGFTATSGPELPQPPKVDAVVTYIDRWVWDITMYMLELTITLRNPASNFPLAVGNSFHTSLSRLSPEEMVDEVLTNIFKGPQPVAKGGSQ